MRHVYHGNMTGLYDTSRPYMGSTRKICRTYVRMEPLVSCRSSLRLCPPIALDWLVPLHGALQAKSEFLGRNLGPSQDWQRAIGKVNVLSLVDVFSTSEPATGEVDVDARSCCRVTFIKPVRRLGSPLHDPGRTLGKVKFLEDGNISRSLDS